MGCVCGPTLAFSFLKSFYAPHPCSKTYCNTFLPGTLPSPGQAVGRVGSSSTDLLPPFRTKGVKQDVDDEHPDGLLFLISHCCSLDCVIEGVNMPALFGGGCGLVEGVLRMRAVPLPQ